MPLELQSGSHASRTPLPSRSADQPSASSSESEIPFWLQSPKQAVSKTLSSSKVMSPPSAMPDAPHRWLDAMRTPAPRLKRLRASSLKLPVNEHREMSATPRSRYTAPPDSSARLRAKSVP